MHSNVDTYFQLHLHNAPSWWTMAGGPLPLQTHNAACRMALNWWGKAEGCLAPGKSFGRIIHLVEVVRNE